jgi:hypothetical protein
MACASSITYSCVLRRFKEGNFEAQSTMLLNII